jgi:hypothetical protein
MQASSFNFADRPRGAIVPWIPAMVGVGILAGLMISILVWTPAGPPASQPAAGPARPPAGPSRPPAGAAPAAPPSAAAGLGIASRPHAPSMPASATRSTAPKAPRKAPPVDVTGRYRVVASYQTEFIGEVLVSNASGRPRDWTVQLAFGSDVGAMRTFWVESQPQATLRRVGASYVFTSAVPVAARSSVVLRVQFDRSGRDNTPVSCSTNGLTCAGL